MSKKNTYKEPINDNEDIVSKKFGNESKITKGIRYILDGSILTKKSLLKYVRFMFFLVGIAILYIANTYNAEKKVMEIEKIKKEIKELRSEYVTTKSKLMFHSRQSELIKKLEPLQIKESLTPPIKIFVKPNNTKQTSRS